MEGRTKNTFCGSMRRSQKQSMQPWDQGSRGSRRPDWDDRFTVPEQQPKGRTQVEGVASIHPFRASTPDRVLKEVIVPNYSSYLM